LAVAAVAVVASLRAALGALLEPREAVAGEAALVALLAALEAAAVLMAQGVAEVCLALD
jgi:hypothetical protein